MEPKPAISMKLTPREQAAFDRLSSGDVCTSQDLHDALGARGLASANRNALVILIKYLSAKVAPHGYIIENRGGIGRGAKVAYTMVKRF